jgi:hypothetical protein
MNCDNLRHLKVYVCPILMRTSQLVRTLGFRKDILSDEPGNI